MGTSTTENPCLVEFYDRPIVGLFRLVKINSNVGLLPARGRLSNLMLSYVVDTEKGHYFLCPKWNMGKS